MHSQVFLLKRRSIERLMHCFTSRALLMKRLSRLPIVFALALASAAHAETVKHDIPYTEDQTNKKLTLDIFAPKDAKNLPVVFWIHGGGWHAGDKTDVKAKPELFMDKGFVFVSINYRLLPEVDMDTLNRDVAKAFKWVEDHIAEHGGDPKRVLVGGHSAGAELAALICTDDSYLKEQGISFKVLIGCVPVDGDTYDIPAIVNTEENRRKIHGQPEPKVTHRNEFGTTPENLRRFSAVTHVAKGKDIPPFLILYVAGQPDTNAQAFRLDAALKEAGLDTRAFGARDTYHSKLNDDLGLAGDPATSALYEFIAQVLKK
jgi:acetyl esterase/lipase